MACGGTALLYRTREGIKVEISKYTVDNRNKYLLLKYNGHTNVEICASIRLHLNFISMPAFTLEYVCVQRKLNHHHYPLKFQQALC
jgi:hypothetical protein